jgi:hypothetical protein
MLSHQTPVTGMKTTVGPGWRKLRHHVETTSASWRRMIAAERNWVTLARALRPFLEEMGEPGLRMDRHYYLERIDEKHRYGLELRRMQNIWLKQRSRTPFFEWLSSRQHMMEEGASDGVRYLADSAQRSDYLVRIVGKKLVVSERMKQMLDRAAQAREEEAKVEGRELTSNERDHWLSFVMDGSGRMYAALPDLYVIHHSSFLSGARVQMAGQIIVDPDLRIWAFTNFSGHYRPGDDVSEAFLTRLESEGVDLSAFAFGVRDGEEVDMGDGDAAEWLKARRDRAANAGQSEAS